MVRWSGSCPAQAGGAGGPAGAGDAGAGGPAGDGTGRYDGELIRLHSSSDGSIQISALYTACQQDTNTAISALHPVSTPRSAPSLNTPLCLAVGRHSVQQTAILQSTNGSLANWRGRGYHSAAVTNPSLTGRTDYTQARQPVPPLITTRYSGCKYKYKTL